jgi:AcrR family transcriptional regulator
VPRGLSQRAHQKVLAAATELFASRGIDATSMDAIATAATVSKATVYKHWVDKDALCLEVLLYVHRSDEDPGEQISGDLRADMKSFLAYEPPSARAEIQRRLTPHLIAHSARNPEFGRAWRARVSERVREGLRKLLHRGMEAGSFSVALDEELSVALLLGPMMYRHIFGPTVDRRWLAEGVVDSFWKAHARSEGKRTSGRMPSRTKVARKKATSSAAQKRPASGLRG